MDRAQLQGEQTMCVFGNWGVAFEAGLWAPGELSVQTPGSGSSPGRLRRCRNDPNSCLTLILVAPAVLAGWTKPLMCGCVYCMLPVLLS